MVVCREQERELLVRFVRGEDGRRLALLVGEAGIGKTALWSDAVGHARASGATVLTARPTAAETASSFAGLGDLLSPVVDPIASLPELPRKALGAALLIEAGPALPELRAVGVGVLALLRELGGVLIAVDDWQCLDAPSAAVLTFVLRRVPENVRALATVRGDVADPQVATLARALSEGPTLKLALGPWTAADLGTLVEVRLGRALSMRALTRLEASSGGNPLIALEVMRAEASGRRANATDIQRLLAARIAGLSPLAREVVRAAAALALPTATVVEQVVGDARRGREALEEVLVADVLERDGERLHFTHPLIAGAAEQLTPPSAWRETHRRLADLVDDVEQRARHLGQATAEPDARTAASLEDAAAHAAARGASAAAGELADRAGDLTPAAHAAARVRRKLLAGDAFQRAGERESARRVLEALVTELGPGPDRARALFRLGALFWDARSRTLGEQALAEAGSDDRLRAEIHVMLGSARQFLDGVHAGIPHAELALRHAEASGDVPLRVKAMSQLALHRFAAGQGVQRATLAAAARLEQPGVPNPLDTPGSVLAFELAFSGDFDGAREAFTSELRRAHAAGAVTQASELHHIMAELELRAGRPLAARAQVACLAELGLGTVDGCDDPSVLWIRSLVEGHLGHAESAERLALRGLRVLDAAEDRIARVRLSHALGVLALSRGRGDAAARWLAPLPSLQDALGVREPGIFQLHADVAEAQLLVGDIAGAATALAELERHPEHPWAAGAALRVRAMLHAVTAGPAGAVATHRAAVEALADARQPLELARALLALGSTQRRAKQRAAARRSLDAAAAAFRDIDAPLWCERAETEIARLGGRRASSRDELTENEQRVAALAAQGLTNRDIAARLFVSERTVESNLTRAYRKLGVRSRAQLARDFADGRVRDAPAHDAGGS
jgi:DNA-binding NarL/FixJ family response regulator